MTAATPHGDEARAALTEAYGRIGQLADDVLAQARQDQPAEDRLDELERLVCATAPLWQSLEQSPADGSTSQQSEALAQMRRVLAESLDRVRAASEEAAASLRRLGDQLDEGIRGQKGNRAYRTNHP